MSKELNDIDKKIDQIYKNLHKQNNEFVTDISSINKNQEKVLKDINELKKEIKNISFKVDIILDILNNFTIMLSEDEDNIDDDNYIGEDGGSWVPEQDENWNSYNENDDDY